MAQSGILSLFARSPIRPLQQHMQKVQLCVDLLLPYFDAVLTQDWKTAENLQQGISIHEREADALKMDLRLHLPKGLFLPVPRMDLLKLLDKQENIANLAKDIAGIMLGRKMQLPESMTKEFRAYLARCVDATVQAGKATNELDELLESGFRGKEVTLVETIVRQLNDIEYETDQMQIHLRQSLFQVERNLNPIDVMFLYKIIEKVGLLADCAEEVGHRLRMLTAQ